MPENEFQIEQIGEIYARALLNLADQNGVGNEIAEDVRGIGELLRSNAGFAQLMSAVTLSPEEHVAVLEKIFGGRVHALTLETLKSMARRSRLMFLRGLVEGVEEVLKQRSGRVDAEVICAAELPAQTLSNVRDAIGRATGKQADLQVRIVPEILGGIQVRVGDTLIDASVESQLQRMKQRIQEDGMAALQKRFAAIVG